MHRSKLFIDVAGGRDISSPARRLLAFLATNDAPSSTESIDTLPMRQFSDVVVYLHGFPDLAVHPTKLDTASRLPFKIAEAWLDYGKQQKKPESVAFLTFNFGGVLGSDHELAFFDKTISMEVEDAVSVCDCVRKTMLVDGGRVHVVGLSTGAIIGSLLRAHNVADTITVIAGLVDLQKGIEYDFSPDQVQQFERDGACWKEFYLPEGSELPQGASVSLDGVVEATRETLEALEEMPRKVYFRLSRRYYDECTSGALDIRSAVSVSSDSGLCPFLVIHGDDDQNVPFADGEALFAAAAEPKTFVAINKANHLLTNSRHVKKALQAIIQHISGRL